MELAQVNTHSSNSEHCGSEMKSVLIAEKNREAAREMGGLLAAHGYVVLTMVRTGEEAVTGAQWLRPDLVVMGAELEGEVDAREAMEEISLTTQSKVLYIGDEPGPRAGDLGAGTGWLRRSADEQELLVAADTLTERDRFSEFEASEWAGEFMMA